MPGKASHSTTPSNAPQSLAVETVLGKLEKVRRSGRGWTARCPAHEDKQNSLSLGVGDDGRVLLRCFAGCEVEAVVASIGLAMQDLFEKPTTSRPPGGGGVSPPGPRATVQPDERGGLTLAEYGAAKRHVTLRRTARNGVIPVTGVTASVAEHETDDGTVTPNDDPREGMEPRGGGEAEEDDDSDSNDSISAAFSDVLLGPDPDAWPEEARYEYEEQVAVLHIEAEVPLPEAKRRAEARVRGFFAA